MRIKPEKSTALAPVPKALNTGFYKPVFHIILVRYPEKFHQWDQTNYEIYGPLSLDDEAKVVVRLINKDRSVQEVTLAL